MPELPSVPGYEVDGEWLVASDVRAEMERRLREPVPRRYGPLDQLRVDLATIQCRILYGGIVALLLIAAVARDLWSALAATVLILYFGRGFVDGIRTVRHGVAAFARIGSVEYDYRIGGTNTEVLVDGHRMNVGFDLAPVTTIRASGCDVEMRVFYVPHQRKLVANAFAYRAIEPGPATPGEPAKPISF